MTQPGEISRSITGAAQLFLGRDRGLSYLDRSFDGFWRSFSVILLVLPIHVLTLYAVSRTPGGSPFGAAFRESLPLLALDWVLFPAILALAAKPLDVSRDYVPYVVARNWAAPIAASITLVPFMLQGAGWVPNEGAALLTLVALGVVLRFHYMILRIALKVTVPLAIGLMAVDFMLSLLLVGLFRS